MISCDNPIQLTIEKLAIVFNCPIDHFRWSHPVVIINFARNDSNLRENGSLEPSMLISSFQYPHRKIVSTKGNKTSLVLSIVFDWIGLTSLIPVPKILTMHSFLQQSMKLHRLQFNRYKSKQSDQ